MKEKMIQNFEQENDPFFLHEKLYSSNKNNPRSDSIIDVIFRICHHIHRMYYS